MKKPRKQKAKKRQPPRKQTGPVTPPPTPPSFKSSYLLWLSGAAAAFTLFGGLQVVLDIADWARWFVERWRGYTFAFWKMIGDFIGIRTYPQTALLLTFVACIVPISVAAMRLEPDRDDAPASVWAYLKSHEFVARMAGAMSAASGAVFLYCLAVEYFIAGRMFTLARPGYVFALVSSGFLFVMWLAAIAYYQGAREAGHFALLAMFVAVFYFILTLQTTLGRDYPDKEQAELERYLLLHISAAWIPAHIAGFLSWARPQFFNYRFAIILLTLAALLALNYISLQQWSLKAPV